MRVESVKCESCGAHLKISWRGEIVTCEYCGSKNLVVVAADPEEEMYNTQGQVVIRASDAFIGELGRYNIYNAQKQKIASIRAGEVWSQRINEDTCLFAKCNVSFFSDIEEIKCYADQVNKFYITTKYGGFGFSITKVE
ncbi:MAG: hypothetical protein AAGU75_16170 [Bacillota bacterium]|uniref:hypothetical protein n=1 Tax=Desulfitobacterium hafniense TaxID=49338 RepID=UPI0003812582|nr:hypothetical protein [Desulfitobacterium hafniense]